MTGVGPWGAELGSRTLHCRGLIITEHVRGFGSPVLDPGPPAMAPKSLRRLGPSGCSGQSRARAGRPGVQQQEPQRGGCTTSPSERQAGQAPTRAGPAPVQARPQPVAAPGRGCPPGPSPALTPGRASASGPLRASLSATDTGSGAPDGQPMGTGPRPEDGEPGAVLEGSPRAGRTPVSSPSPAGSS